MKPSRRPRFFFVSGLCVGALGCGPFLQAQVGFEKYFVSGFGNDIPVESVSGATAGDAGGSATASAGTISAISSGQKTSLPGGGSSGFSGSYGNAGYTNSRFLLDPEAAGSLGVVHVTASLNVDSVGSEVTVGDFTARNNASASASIYYGSAGQSVSSSADFFGNTGPQQGTFSETGQIRAGYEFTVFAGVSVNTSVNYYGMGGSSSASASVNLAYTIELTEDRLHWTSADTTIQVAAPSQWAESLELNNTRYAVFNDVAARTLSLSLDQNQEWRGLIVDGETLALNLGGKTLTLGSQGPSVRTNSILVGEGRYGTSQLTLSNGTAVLDYDILVGADSSNPGGLILENGAILREESDSISAIIGSGGTGNLTVRGGSRLQASQVILGNATGGNGTAEVTGAGSRLETVGLFVGNAGQGTLTVRNGAVAQASRLGIASAAGASGTMTVEGPGSRLEMQAIPNSNALIGTGAGSTATLEIKDGATLAGDDIAFTVGSGNATDSAAFRVTGAGTSMTDVGLNVHTGGSFQLSDGATWTNGGLFVAGGEARIQANATATLNNSIRVGGVVVNNNVTKTGLLTVGHGSKLTTGDLVEVERGGTISVNGTGASIEGFTTLDLKGGHLNVSNGGKVIAATTGLGLGEIIIQAGGSLSGSNGAIQANVFVNGGADLRPGNSPGTLTIEGDLTLADGAHLQLELGGTEAGTGYDQLIVTGDALFDEGAIIEFAFVNGFAPTEGQTFSFFDVAGDFDFTEGSVILDVSGLEEGWDYETGFVNGAFTLTSLSDAIALSAVPEPSACAALAGLGGLALAVMHKRRRIR